MRISVVKYTSPRRRQRFTFDVAPVHRDVDGLTLVLEEYAVEICERSNKWARPRQLFYKRQRRPGADMPLAEVPQPDESVKALVVVEIVRGLRFVAQDVNGLINL